VGEGGEKGGGGLIKKILGIKDRWVPLILPNTFLKELMIFMK